MTQSTQPTQPMQLAHVTQPAESAESLYMIANYAKLNAFRHDHNNLKKRYSAAVAHNEALQYSLETVKTDFKQIVAAYENLTESDMMRRVEVETLKQECDVLKRQNNLCTKYDPAKDALIADLKSELRGVNARNAELDAMRVSWARSLPKDTKRSRSE